jgi:flagellar biosynthesis protein FlhB
MSAPDRDQRTIEPTPRRVEEFRKRGEIALSRDLSAAGTLAGGAIGAALFSVSQATQVARFVRDTLGSAGALPLYEAIGHAGAVLVSAATPVIGGALVGYLATSALQLGWPPAFRPLGFDVGKLLSAGAIARWLSPRETAVRALKACAKVAVVGSAALFALRDVWIEVVRRPALGVAQLGLRMAGAASQVSLLAGGALVALAVFDYVLARRDIRARMRMTAAEARREHREQEGDPLVRRKRRQRMRELAKRRLASAVRGADVVVVNPTEYAVALRYRSGEDRAPRVVAKGRGELAERIRGLARAAGVPILPEPPLARLLHKLVAEGREVPAALYHAVAEVLAYVYRLRGSMSGPRGTWKAPQ